MKKPVMLYSIGKGLFSHAASGTEGVLSGKAAVSVSSCNTTWKFKEMIEFRDKTAKKYGLDMIEYINEDGVKRGINPFDHGAAYTDIMKTQALKQGFGQIWFHRGLSAAAGEMRKSPAPRSVFSPSVIPACLGSEESAPGNVEAL